MPESGVFGAELDLIYVDLDNIQGAYVSEPGEDPFIAINISLKDKQDPTANIIYQALLTFHRALPDVYRLFPIRKFYEDLPQHLPLPILEPEIIFIGRAFRRWKYPVYLPANFRLIG